MDDDGVKLTLTDCPADCELVAETVSDTVGSYFDVTESLLVSDLAILELLCNSFDVTASPDILLLDWTLFGTELTSVAMETDEVSDGTLGVDDPVFPKPIVCDELTRFWLTGESSEVYEVVAMVTSLLGNAWVACCMANWLELVVSASKLGWSALCFKVSVLWWDNNDPTDVGLIPCTGCLAIVALVDP